MQIEIVTIACGDGAEDAAILSAVLALNTAHEEELSPLDSARLRRLVTQSFAAFRIGEVEAFLIAFDQAADYDSPNFIWFRDRYPRFVYIDRVAVSQAVRGRGHARKLYEELFARARLAGHDQIVCEVNAMPPNPASDAFHHALGFGEVGAGEIHGGAKTVRYFLRRLGADEAP